MNVMRGLGVMAVGLGLMGTVGVAQQIQISKENKTIAITTSDEAEALADTAVITVGFRLYGKDQDGTYAEASKVSNAVMSALTGAGVAKEAVESANQNLSPFEPNSDSDKARYAQGMRFVFSQSWQVTVPASKAGDVLHTAITSGANDSGGIKWKLAKDDALEAEAAGKALAHGRQIAERMASGLGVKLGALVYASNQMPSQVGVYGMPMGGRLAMSAAAMDKVKPLAIVPEKISKSATVYAVFAIE